MNMLVVEGANRQSGSPKTKRARLIRRRWLVAASAGAIAAATPGYMGFYGGRARAQTLPPGCADAITTGTPNDNDGVAEDGETITCVVASPTTIGAIDTTGVDDLTVVIGDASTPTTVTSGSGDGIAMSGGGAQTLTVNAGSSVSGIDDGVYIAVSATSVDDLTVVSEGDIDGGSGWGINARNYGGGGSTITVSDVSANEGIYLKTGGSGGTLTISDGGAVRGLGANGTGIWVDVGGGDFTIDTSGGAANNGVVSAGLDAVYANNKGSGKLTVTTANVSSTNETGVRTVSGTSGGATTIDTSAGTVSGGRAGVDATQNSDALLSIKVGAVSGNVGVDANAKGGATEITLISTANVVGATGAGVDAQSEGGTISVTGLSDPNTGLSGAIITGATDGVYLRSKGAALTVRNLDTVKGLGGHGVDADARLLSAQSGGGVTLSGGGDVTISGITNIVGYGDGDPTTDDQGHGVKAISGGLDISIQNLGVGGLVEGRDGDGIYARLDIAGGYGINIGGEVDSATGEVIGAIGNVKGSRNGIYAYADTGSSDIIINTSKGGVTGGLNGIKVGNYGSGSVSITAYDVASLAGGEDAVNVNHFGDSDRTLTILTTGTVSGAQDGIDARAANSALSITTTGAVTAAGVGVKADQDSDELLSISVDDVTAGVGVSVDAELGKTEITLASTANIVGTTGAGVSVRSGKTTTYGGDVTLDGQSGATVAGATDGISLQWKGISSLNKTTISSIVSAKGYVGSGINVSAGAVTITGVDNIYGSASGINALGALGVSIQGVGGTGNLVEGAVGHGIRAELTRSGSINIGGDEAVGNVRGAIHGIYVDANKATSVTIDSAGGFVEGGATGILVDGYYSPLVTITTADVTGGDVTAGTGGDGIAVVKSIKGLTLDSSDGVVKGGANGIRAEITGAGAAPIVMTVNDVRGYGGAGIRATSSRTAGQITIQGSSGDIIGATDGIFARTVGPNITVRTLDSVTGQGGHGLDVDASGGDITISDITTIVGYGDGDQSTGDQGHGVKAVTFGGDISIQRVGLGDGNLVEGKDGHGIYARSAESNFVNVAGDIKIGGEVDSATGAVTGIGNVTGSRYGISAVSGLRADVDITIASTAHIQGLSGPGVFARAGGFEDGLISLKGLSGGRITGATHGVDLYNQDSLSIGYLDSITGLGGDGIKVHATFTTITSIGAVYGTANGIVRTAAGKFAGISIQGVGLAGGVTGRDGNGINVTSIGNRSINIGGEVPVGDVTGGVIGIYSNTFYGGAVIDSSGGTVTGGVHGIVVTNSEYQGNYGDARTNITTANVTGTTGDGIRVVDHYKDDLTIDTSKGAVRGGARGIHAAYDDNTSPTFLTVNYVRGYGAEGIRVTTTGSNAHISVQGSSGDVIGATDGILTHSTGANITVQTLDSVTGQGGDGLDVSSNGGAITISDVTTITGYGDDATTGDDGHGVFAISAGGDISIQRLGVDGLVEGKDGAGIYARAGAGSVNIGGDADGAIGNVKGSYNGVDVAVGTGGGDLTINTSAGAVEGASTGISAGNYGSGAISITTAGVTGADRRGVYAYNGATATDMMIDTSRGAVTSGDYDGILARNEGSGALSITAADVTVLTGLAGAADGVDAVNYGTDLTIVSTGAVSGVDDGIDARNKGGGALSISASGAVSGVYRGIVAYSYGGGGTSVTTADVTGTSGVGVIALNIGGGDLVVDTSAGAVEGGSFGIRASNAGFAGDSATTITTADVTGAIDDGIEVVTSANTTDLTIDTRAGAVTGGDNGLYAHHGGVGALSITVKDVTALAGGDDAVDAYNSDNGTSLTITTGGVIASAGGDGIDAVNYGTDLSISVDGGSVTGFDSAITAYNYGSGSTVIRIAGAAEGETEEGLRAVTANGARVTIENGGSVTGATAAIVTDSTAAPGEAVDDTLTLNTGGSVTGDVLLLAGEDVFNDASGLFTTVFGGDGLDTVNFSGGARTVTGSGAAGDSLQQFEVFNISSDGLVLAGTHLGLDEANFLAGANTLTGSLEATTALIASGATLNAADGSQIIGVLTNNGTLNVGDSPGTLTVDGDLVLGASSVLPIEIGATSDLIVVTGDVTLGGALDVIILPGTPFGVSTRTIIDGGTGLSGAFDIILGGDGLLIRQAVGVDTASSDLLLTTTIIPASFVGGLTNNQAAAGDSLISLLSDPSLDPALLGVIAAVGAIEDADALGTTLGEFTPEGLDPGLKFLTTSQSRFIDLALGQASIAGDEPGSTKLAALNGGPVAAPSDGVGVAWGALEVYGLSQDGAADHIDFDGTAFSFAAGVSGIAAGPVSFGFAGGYSSFDGDTDGALGDAADANLFHIAATASARFGFSDLDARLDTVVGYVTGDNELAMNLVDPSTDAPVSQRGDADMSSIDWLTRFSINGAHDREWALKPYVQTGVTVYRQDAAGLGATGVTALAVEKLNNTRWQIGVGATYDRRIADRLSVSARAAGVQYFDDTENIFSSRFAAAPAGSPAFRTTGREVDRQVQLDAALAYAHHSGFMVSVGAFGEFGDLDLYGGSLRVQKRF